MLTRRPSTTRRCGKCGHVFRTLEDEADMHPCPRCGYTPWIEDYHDDLEEG